MKAGDIVQSHDERDAAEATFVVLETGIAHVSGTVVKVMPTYTNAIYRLEKSLEVVAEP